MLKKSLLKGYLYFDIETVPQYQSFEAMPVKMQNLWIRKHHFRALSWHSENYSKELQIEQFFNNKPSNSSILTTAKDFNFNASINDIYTKEAALHPEFGKIFCITLGAFNDNFEKHIFSIFHDDEKSILDELVQILMSYEHLQLCGFNIQEFDLPFILKRMWINGIVGKYPEQLCLGDAKPWTVKHLDLMQAYKSFSREYCSLDMLCLLLDVKSPKEKFNNSDFNSLLAANKITAKDGVEYCERDVEATMEVALRLSSDDSNFYPDQQKPQWKSTKKIN